MRLLFALSFSLAFTAYADDDQPWPSTAVSGPAEVELVGQAKIALPATHLFIPKAGAAEMLEQMGNVPGDNLVGMIAPKDLDNEEYFITVRWDAEGFVKDDEADQMDTDEMLASFKEGAEASNEFRTERGFKPIHIEGWGQVPSYDAKQHHIMWGLIVGDEDGRSINYNTRLLGREGYLALNLVCAPEKLEPLRPVLSALLRDTKYVEGKRYADFSEGKDKVAEYGLAALVMGGAAVGAKTFLKVGLIAKFSKVILAALIAGKKAIVVGLLAIAALFKKLFGSKANEPKAPPPTEPPAPPAS